MCADSAPGEHYLVDGADGMLLGLSLMRLIDSGRLFLDVLLPDIIPPERLPEMRDPTVRRLMRRGSGLPDPIRGVLLPELYCDPAFSGLSDEEKNEKFRAAILEHRALDRQMDLLRSGRHILRLRRVPSGLDTAILAEVVERLSENGLMEFQRENILSPLEIIPLPCQPEYEEQRIHALTLDQLERLAGALACGDLPISAECRDLSAAASGRQNLPFYSSRNVLCGHSEVAGHTVDILFDPDAGVSVLSASRTPLPVIRQSEDFLRLDVDIIYHMNAFGVFPRQTRLEPTNGHYLLDLLSMRLEEEQRDFVSSPVMLIAEKVTEEFRDVKQVYMIVDEGVAVGALAIKRGVGTGNYVLDTLLIDRRFQRRGFGSAALLLVIDLLRSMEGRRVTVCVSPANTAALRLYERHGFRLAAVYDSALAMELTL